MEVANSTGKDITWEYLFKDLADPRTSEWFLMSNPIPVAVILFSYLYFVLKCGPEYMKNKKPYSLNRILMFYNLIQVAWNLWIFNEAVIMWSNFNWNCQNVDWSYSAVAMRQRIACYSYFINKISDLLDTVFFVLRKKDRQISFLHVFHHTLMPMTSWMMVKYFPGGHVTFIGLLNTFVHILLYGYYFLAAFGPSVQKYLWWKKYITKLQLLQFCLVFIHNSQLLFFDCGFPRWTLVLTLPNAIFFYYLFNEFYKDSYEKPKVANNKSKKESVKSK
ncbi:elongation of very long chain fatty acids protein AAEL008004 [Anthonomus grandis grandis]|uniref:elongation of very long chain fatty acids protein AAEL008004 n=1 Tax=Anthonomus grandis grandis TaxID=2921223 RepID=UPI0021663FAA|nr:elongation of very long chain fatty acids protein AAEL008004 [Anthonomus grandis grandis]